MQTCKHCDFVFMRPSGSPIPADCCEGCHKEIEAMAEAVKTGRKNRLMEDHKRLLAEKREFLRGAKATIDPTMYDPARAEICRKYEREIKPGVWVDVYDVLKAFDVRNAALQHLIKKALAPGQRGHKDLMTDLDDIIASAKRAKELEQ